MEYEDYVKMMAFIDAATDVAFGKDEDLPEGVIQDLHDARNRLNRLRLKMLGNGSERPYDVADLGLDVSDG